jgi:acyl carrier protein
MNPAEIIAVLKEIIARKLPSEVTAQQIDEHVSLFEGGMGLDSIVLVELIGEIERKLSFQFQDSDLRVHTFENLTNLAQVIATRLASVEGAKA